MNKKTTRLLNASILSINHKSLVRYAKVLTLRWVMDQSVSQSVWVVASFAKEGHRGAIDVCEKEEVG